MRGNNEANRQIEHIIKHAGRGFYIITASPTMQKKIAAEYANAAVYDYTAEETPFDHGKLHKWMLANKDSHVYFMLNMQLALPDTETLHYFNMCRDAMAVQNKIWFFCMTKETDHNLCVNAMDFYDYVSVKIHFEQERDSLPAPQALKDAADLTGFIPMETAKMLLEQYADMESELMALSIEDTPDEQLLSAADTLMNIENVYFQTGQYNTALPLLEKAKLIREKALGTDHPSTAITYNNIALVYRKQGNYAKALGWYIKSFHILLNKFGKTHPNTNIAKENMRYAYISHYGEDSDFEAWLINQLT